jgi:hypothetical protein
MNMNTSFFESNLSLISSENLNFINNFTRLDNIKRKQKSNEIVTLYVLSFCFIVIIFYIGIFGRRLISTNDFVLAYSFKKYRKQTIQPLTSQTV